MVGGSEGCIHRRTRADYSIGEPVVAIGDRKDLLACFANGLSRRSNMVTNNLVDSLTNRTGIQRGGCFGRHRTCSIRRESRRNYMTAARAELSLDPPPSKKKFKRDESVTVPTDETGVQFFNGNSSGQYNGLTWSTLGATYKGQVNRLD